MKKIEFLNELKEVIEWAIDNDYVNLGDVIISISILIGKHYVQKEKLKNIYK